MTKPLIGVTSYQRNEEDRFTLPANYLDVVERAGGIPVIIAPTEDNIASQLDRLDGVVLTGGADVDPGEYGGERKEAVYGVNPERDRYELELTRLALRKKLPIMAICRGLQVLNVAMGGTLVEHVPDEYGETVLHRGGESNKVDHPVSIAPGSKLAEILSLTEMECASYHHQSVRQPAPGFEVVASADDGVIEAIESDEYPQVIAVQWHPEYTAKTDPNQRRLFDVFIEWSRGEPSVSKAKFSREEIQPAEAAV